MKVLDLFRRSAPAAEDKDISFNDLIERMATVQMVRSGMSVTPKNAMKCTTIQGIVRALTNAIGSYPPSVGVLKSSEAGEYVESMPNHSINRILRKPNAVHTSTEFFRMVMKQCALEGNFYAIKGQGLSGPIAYLRPIEDPDIVTVDDVNWRTGVTYRVEFNEGTKFVPQSQMLHCTSGIIGDDGVTGVSPVNLAKEAIGICIAAEQMIAELFGNSAIPSLLLTGGKFVSEEQYDLWVRKFRQVYGRGAQHAGGTALLPEGMEAKELQFKPADSQLLETRKFQRIEIAQVYGVPPHKLADLERATFSNIEEQSLEFVRDVAAPWVRLLEQGMARDLLSEKDQAAGVVIRFDMEAATEGKLKDRVEAYGKAYTIGAMNPNEVRQRLGLDPRKDPGGNEFATQLNMRTNGNVPDDTEDPKPSDDDAEGEPDDGGNSQV